MLTASKHLRHKEVVWGILILSFAISIYYSFLLPDAVAIHWNSAGIPDAFAPRTWGPLLIPSAGLLLITLILFLLEHDQRRDDIRAFFKYAEVFLILLALFIFYINLISLTWNLMAMPPAAFIFVPAISAIAWYAGGQLQITKTTARNAAIETRVKRRAGIYLKIASLVVLASIFTPEYSALICSGAICIACALAAYYSFRTAGNHRPNRKK